MVAEWISLEEMLKLQELSPAVTGILKEWLDDQILDSFGDQTWTDMSEEWRRSELVRQPGVQGERDKGDEL